MVVTTVLWLAVIAIAAFLVLVWRAASAEHREGSRVPPLRAPVQTGSDDVRVRRTAREQRADDLAARAGREQPGPPRG